MCTWADAPEALELELQMFGGRPAWELEMEVRSFWKSRRAAKLWPPPYKVRSDLKTIRS